MKSDDLSENPIDAIAFEWVARLDRAPLSSREDATLKAWLAQDVRHRGAFTRARTIWVSAGRVAAFQGTALPTEPPASAPLSRRAFSRFALAAGLAAAAVIPGKPAEASRIYQARSGLLHVQEPLCGDLILDQGTVLRVRRGPGAPCLDLLRGQAHLTARKAPVRLNMDGLSIDLPDGASLIAHACGAESDALVLGGHILTRCAGEKERRVLHRRDWIRYEHNLISLSVLSDDDLERVTAWSRGLLEFQSVNVTDAIRQINRYNTQKIVLKNPACANRRISGIFSLSDPVIFARILSEIFGTKTLIAPTEISLL